MDVFPIFFGPEYVTDLWMSARAIKELKEYTKKENRPKPKYLNGRLQQYAIDGFETWIGDATQIRHEHSGVYRIGHRKSTFRLFGFFIDNNSGFIITGSCNEKSGGGRGVSFRCDAALDEAVEVRSNQSWNKKRP